MDLYVLETLAELNRKILIFATEGISADISRSHRLTNSSESFNQLHIRLHIFYCCLYTFKLGSEVTFVIVV